MSFLPFPARTTSEAIALIKQDGGILHEVIHGDQNTEVLTENGLIPSVNKAITDIMLRIAAGDVFPTPPTSIRTIVNNFDITAIPVLAGIGLGTVFEFALGETSNLMGRGTSMVFAGLRPDTEYTIYARTVNWLGTSAWAIKTVRTSRDATDIIGIIGDDIGDAVFDDVLTSVNASLQQTVAEATADKLNANEVQQLIDESIFLVNEGDSEDSRIALTNNVLGVLDNYGNKVQIQNVNFALAREGQLRAAQIIALNAGNQALVQSVLKVETDLQGNSMALSQLSGQVNNPANGLSATFDLVQVAKTTADNAASSTTLIQNQVNHPVSGLAATATIANAAKVTADGNTQSIIGLNSSVQGLGGRVDSAEITLSTTVNSLGQVSARAFLGVTSVTSGVARINGIVVDGATNSLEFRADTLRLTDTNGNLRLYWDAGRGKWVYADDIVAGTFQTALSGFRAEMSGIGGFPFWYGTGAKTAGNAKMALDSSGNVLLRDAQINMIGTSFMRIESANPFGPDNLISWYGLRLDGINYDTSTGLVIPAGLRRNNATSFITSSGQYYFGGTIASGTLRNAAQATGFGNTFVDLGPYSSNGGLITIRCSLAATGGMLVNGTCPMNPANPQAWLIIERWDGSSFVEQDRKLFTGYTDNVAESGPQCLYNAGIFGSFTFTDSLQSTANRLYRLRVEFISPVPFVSVQSVSIVSEE